jgi:hypothetical protein
VNRSELLKADTSPFAVTVTSTAPAICEGDTAWIDVSLTTTNEAAGTAPNITELALVNPDPPIVTAVPPAVLPVPVLNELIAGADTLEYVYCDELPVEDVPVGVVTWTYTLPGAPPGAVARIALSESTVKLAGMPPNVTAMAPVK